MAKCNIRVPHGRISCALGWGLWKTMYPILYFLKVKYYTKRKKINKDKSFHGSQSKY